MTPGLAAPVAAVADRLAGLPGVVAVALGGSRATGEARSDSDWDLGLYYRGSQRPSEPGDLLGLGERGYVSALGEWGPIMNGGGWLTVGGLAVDVLYRDLDVVERWAADARRGRFEILMQNGYVAGAPTYMPVGEQAIGRPIAGELRARSSPRPWPRPRPSAGVARRRWL